MTFRKKLILSNLILITLTAALIAAFLWGSGGLLGGLFFQPGRLQTLGILLALLSILLLIVLTIAMTASVMRSLLRSINTLKQAVRRIQEGELNSRLDYRAHDEFAEVFDALDVMRERLAQSIRERDLLEQRRAEMLANISHDLKTPVTSISGYAQGLLDGVADTPEKTEKYLRTICAKAEDVNRLADDLFIFSKLDTGLPVRDMETVDFAAYLNRLLDEFEDFQIVRAFDCPESLHVSLDSGLFARVIRNVAENSGKYCGKAVCTIHAGLKRQGDRAILSLADDGPGVPLEQLDRIFERFYRGDTARTNPGAGSGLGLSIARQIVEAHGGQIWAREPEAGGLCIYISLPLCAAR